MVPLFYDHMQELCLQKELMQHHCTMHQRNLFGTALQFRQIMDDDVSAVIRSGEINHSQFKALTARGWVLSKPPVSRSATQDLLNILRTHVHNSPPQVHNPSHVNPLHNTSYHSPA
jgi:hypothetical protein